MSEANVDATLNKVSGAIDELDGILESVVANDTAILDALSQMLGALHQMQLKNEQFQQRVAEELSSLILTVQRLESAPQSARQPMLAEAGSSDAQNPEEGLLEFLFPFLAAPVAIDVGANVGKVSERLLAAGYTVYAFEPYGPSFDRLTGKLGGDKNFHALQAAIGSADGTMNLHIASDTSPTKKWDPSLFHSLTDHPMLEDCKFSESVPVTVRSLASLIASGEIPKSGGLLKIDTEGFDLEVIKGLGDAVFSVIMTEYWDKAHPFGKAGHGQLDQTVAAMSKRGYPWYIVIYHVDETSTTSFYCNRLRTIPKSWGNAFFFSDYHTFGHAVRWCTEALRQTAYF